MNVFVLRSCLFCLEKSDTRTKKFVTLRIVFAIAQIYALDLPSNPRISTRLTKKN